MEEISYELCVYESVDDKSLSYVIAQNFTEKEFGLQCVNTWSPDSRQSLPCHLLEKNRSVV